MKKRLFAIFMTVIMLCVTGCGDVKETSSRNNRKESKEDRESQGSEHGEEITDGNIGSSEDGSSEAGGSGEIGSPSDVVNIEAQGEQYSIYNLESLCTSGSNLSSFCMDIVESEKDRSAMQVEQNDVYGPFTRSGSLSAMVFNDTADNGNELMEILKRGYDTDHYYVLDYIVADYEEENFNPFVKMIWTEAREWCHFYIMFRSGGKVNYQIAIQPVRVNLPPLPYKYYAGTDEKIYMVAQFQLNISTTLPNPLGKMENHTYDIRGEMGVIFENDLDNPENWLISGIYPLAYDEGTALYRIGKWKTVMLSNDVSIPYSDEKIAELESEFNACRKYVSFADVSDLIAEAQAKQDAERQENMNRIEDERESLVESVSDEELQQALNAYINWLTVEENYSRLSQLALGLPMYQFIYVNEDRIPELLIASSTYPNVFYMLSYYNGSEFVTIDPRYVPDKVVMNWPLGEDGGHTWYIENENSVAGYYFDRTLTPYRYYRAYLENGGVVKEEFDYKPEDDFDYDRAIKISPEEFFSSVQEAWDALMSNTP